MSGEYFFKELMTKLKCRDIISQHKSQAKLGGISVKQNMPIKKVAEVCIYLFSYVFYMFRVNFKALSPKLEYLFSTVSSFGETST